MNFNTVIFLVNPKMRAVKAVWEPVDEHGKNKDNKYVVPQTLKTLDASIKVGDLVLGETQMRHKMSVFKVVAVDVEVDLENSGYIGWVASKVDSDLDRLKSSEGEIISAIRARDKEKKRAELAETMLKDYGGVIRGLADSGNIAALPAASAAPVQD